MKRKIRVAAALVITLILGTVLAFALFRSRSYSPPTTKPATVTDLKKQLAATTQQKEQASKQAAKPSPAPQPSPPPTPELSPNPQPTQPPQAQKPATAKSDEPQQTAGPLPSTGVNTAVLATTALVSLCVYLWVKLVSQKTLH